MGECSEDTGDGIDIVELLSIPFCRDGGVLQKAQMDGRYGQNFQSRFAGMGECSDRG